MSLRMWFETRPQPRAVARCVSQVYYTRHKITGREYAVKVMEKSFIKKEDKVDLVMMERNVLCVANHPNIVRLLFTFQDATRLYMGMDLCTGKELLATIR